MTKTLLLFSLAVIIALFTAAAANAAAYREKIVTTTVVAEPYCREFTQTFTIGGQTQTGYGMACLQPDGAWEIQQPAKVMVSPIRTVRYISRGSNVYFVPAVPFTVVREDYRYPAHHSYRYYR